MKSRAPSSAQRSAPPTVSADEIAARLRSLPDLRTDTVRALRKELSRELAAADASALHALAAQLIRDVPAEPGRFVAYELVHYHPAALRALDAVTLAQLGADMADWASVDTFACYLSGPAWREGQVSDSLIRRWARSADRWWRRAALVSTVPLNLRARGGRGDARRTLALCALLLADRDEMVVKALSWALRALATRDAPAVAQFVAAHRAELAPRVVREVQNKLTTGLKQPRKSSQKGRR